MAEFPIHTIDNAPEASRPLLEAAQAKFGFVPNLLGELAAAPAALQAYLTLSELLNQTSLTAVEQQIVLLAASVTNKCEYCVAAHSAGLKRAGLDDAQIEAVRQGRAVDDPNLEAVRAFATGGGQHPRMGGRDRAAAIRGRRPHEVASARGAARRGDEDAEQLHQSPHRNAARSTARAVRVRSAAA
jgi:uncharacterized peroxidase-related enzyme